MKYSVKRLLLFQKHHQLDKTISPKGPFSDCSGAFTPITRSSGDDDVNLTVGLERLLVHSLQIWHWNLILDLGNSRCSCKWQKKTSHHKVHFMAVLELLIVSQDLKITSCIGYTAKPSPSTHTFPCLKLHSTSVIQLNKRHPKCTHTLDFTEALAYPWLKTKLCSPVTNDEVVWKTKGSASARSCYFSCAVSEKLLSHTFAQRIKMLVFDDWKWWGLWDRSSDNSSS